jgi:hypothetical protein
VQGVCLEVRSRKVPPRRNLVRYSLYPAEAGEEVCGCCIRNLTRRQRGRSNQHIRERLSHIISTPFLNVLYYMGRGRTNIKRLSPLPYHRFQALDECCGRAAVVFEVTRPVFLPRAEEDLFRVGCHGVQ